MATAGTWSSWYRAITWPCADASVSSGSLTGGTLLQCVFAHCHIAHMQQRQRVIVLVADRPEERAAFLKRRQWCWLLALVDCGNAEEK